MSVRQSFIMHDKEKHRALSYRQVQEALNGAGFALDEVPFRRLCEIFDPTLSKGITLEQYVGMCACLKGSSAAFRAFDKTGRGVIEVDFGQLVYIGTFMR